MASERSPTKGGGDNKKNPVFPVGPAGKRELRRALVRSTDPSDTIQKFQQSHSLHSMLARAFGTTPRHEAVKMKQENNGAEEQEDDSNTEVVESLETGAALSFVSHLGVSQHEVHKRIADTLLKQLDVEIRKTNSEEPLLNLLKQCWGYATTIPELRPVLLTVLRQLGSRTPTAVLKALGEQDEKGEMKHAEVFRPLPPLLKRLVWETDWEDKVSPELEEESDPKVFLDRVKSTLLSNTILPHLKQYTSSATLVTQANQPFVATVRERKILTTQRRALTTVSTTTTTTASTGCTSPKANTLGALTKTAAASTGANAALESSMTTGKSISSIRQLLSDATGGTAAFRPKLLYAVLSILISEHGSLEDNLLGCADHLHCTLVADLLLSATGLPKAYQHVLRLATVLDDSVKAGILVDNAIVKIQACMKDIFKPDPSEDTNAQGGSKDNSKIKKEEKPKPKKSAAIPDESNANGLLNEPSTAFKRQLSRIINASLSAMKEADPQNLFLNPVTDAIAPGYSKIISNPMCIMEMEEKIDSHEYRTLADWEKDVKQMYQNCITYNKGAAGQWFRGEAQRQKKVFKDEVLPQARNLYNKEVEWRKNKGAGVIEEDTPKKRKYPGAGSDSKEAGPASKVVPLTAVYKKANKKANRSVAAAETDTAKNTQAYPSMPALASMLLADPFVVRLLLDRVMRSLRLDVTRGKSLPTGHNVISSLLQLLHMAQWSNQVCAIRGKQYIVPDSGKTPPTSEIETPEDYLMRAMPFESLRKYLPLLSQLLLENELDQRVVVGGDLFDASTSMLETRPAPPPPELWKMTVNIQAVNCLVEGALVHICRPGNGNEGSLAITYPKFATALQEASSTICDDRAFYLCLIQSLLRHKSKLQRPIRDVVVAHFLDILRKPPRHAKRKKGAKKHKKWGTMTSASHECFILLLNEWASLGNLLLPRDLLLKLSSDAIKAADESETLPERKFSSQWNKASDDKSADGYFGLVRKQYERMLEGLPENSRAQWKDEVGLGGDQAMVDVETKQKDVEMKEDAGAKAEPSSVKEEPGVQQETSD